MPNNIDIFELATAIGYARIHLSLFSDLSARNDKKTPPKPQLLLEVKYPTEFTQSPNIDDERQMLMQTNHTYMSLLKSQKMIIKSEPLKEALTMAILFFERQLAALEQSLKDHTSSYTVIFEYAPNLTQTLKQAVDQLENFGMQLFNPLGLKLAGKMN